MPPTAPSRSPAPHLHQNSHRARRIHELLDDLGELLQRGDTQQAETDAHFQASDLPEIDALLGGGFPAGYLSEVTGPASSGRTSLLLALLARATRSGACVAMVDRADAFDPPSAAARGVVLDHVLWVRAEDWRAALRATECLLETDGFPLVVLDWASAGKERKERTGSRSRRGRGAREAQIPEAAWLRLTRLAARQQSTLLLLSNERIAGSRAAVVLEMQPAVAHFTGSPWLLEALETRAVLLRNRVPFLTRTASSTITSPASPPRALQPREPRQAF